MLDFEKEWKQTKLTLNPKNKKINDLINLIDKNLRNPKILSYLLELLIKISPSTQLKRLHKDLNFQQSRRGFLTKAAAFAGLSLLPGRAFGEELELANKSFSIDTIAGKLYFYLGTKQISRTYTVSLIYSVLEHFNEIGISFESIHLLDQPPFPPLKDMDILIFLISEEGIENQFGLAQIAFGDKPIPYLTLLQQFQFPYDNYTARTHIAVINLRALRCSTKEQQLKELSRSCTHELGHGLGASHVDRGVLHPEDRYYMAKAGGWVCKAQQQTFHPENIKMMKSFIKKVKSDNLSDVEILDLRNNYLDKFIKTKN